MRADIHLVQNGHFPTRAKAREAIEAGLVFADGVVVAKPAQKIAPDARIIARPAHPYVSRAALKLVAGLDGFEVEVAGRVCLDVGASTGGFSEVLLERGAALVYAVDVGRDQLHPRLKADPRLISLEGCDARELTRDMIERAPDIIVCDASFIGLEKVIARPLSLAAEGAALLALFKPQFQVGRAGLGKGGIVRPDADVEGALQAVRGFLHSERWAVSGVMDSPVRGGDGNQEMLITARRTG